MRGKNWVVDSRWPPGVQFETIYKVATRAVTEAQRGGLSNAAYADEHIAPAIVAEHEWAGPDGVPFVSVFDSRTGHMLCGFRRLDPDDWFIYRHDGEVEVSGPYRTKKLCLKLLNERTGKIRQSGLYETENGIIFTRENAEAALGRELTKEER